jgi:hypothetical protein
MPALARVPAALSLDTTTRLAEGEPGRVSRGLGRSARPSPSACVQSLVRFNSERKMFTIDTKMPVASHTASASVPC